MPGARRRERLEAAGLAVFAYLPFLLSSPGRVSADTKQYLYLDPDRFLSRVPYLWDPHVAAGTVPHQHIGYLFPMGPYYWFLEHAGVPDWVAQRVWLGSLSFAAALGARWLFARLGISRLGALAGALVYLYTPYQLAFTARMSVLLLPWAALPWIVGLVMGAVRSRGWREPALIALIVFTIGGVNASALVLSLLAPMIWLAFAVRADGVRAAASMVGRVGLLALAVSLYWIAGLRLQAAYGVPVLQLTEPVRAISEFSTPGDVLRGLGNWFFYGRDRVGYSVEQAGSYVDDRPVVLASYLLPALALGAVFVIRWRYRAYFVALVLVGTVFAVGAYPYDNPSSYGRVWRSLAERWSPALALRNTPRVVPVVVLGTAALLAAGISAFRSRRLEVSAALAVALLALGAFAPVWRSGALSDGVERDEDVPDYWLELAASLDRDGDATRVLEIPGSNFATYRWGNTVEPVTPGLIDRPYLAREVLPYGSVASVNLLDAFDRRLQLGTFEPASLVPIARLFGVGTVVVRSDLAWERTGAPRPQTVWALVTDPLAQLGTPTAFGQPDALGPPPAARFDVPDAVPIVRTVSPDQPIVIAGDGDGIVDAAGAGLLDGTAVVLELASLDDAMLDAALDAGADVILTDTNRRRYRSFFSSIRDTAGPTERSGQVLHDPYGTDVRLDVFPASSDAARSVVEPRGGVVDATADGGAGRPEDRAVHAFDGDLRTSWRVSAADPTGHRLTLHTEGAVETDRVRLVQPLDGPRDRVLTRVELRFDGGDPVTIDLGPESLTAGGQVVRFPPRTFQQLDLALVATTRPPFEPKFANAVGFAEVEISGVKVTETVRLPVDVAARIGDAARGHRVDVVLTRLRIDPSERGRQDEELALDRRFELPDTRVFALTGVARVNPNAADGAPAMSGRCRDDLVTVDGEPLGVRVVGPTADARRGLAVEACAGPVPLEAGSHTLRAIAGLDSGIDLDRLVLTSDEAGAPAPVAPRGGHEAPAAEISVETSRADTIDLRVTTDGQPFWLVLGQSANRGWTANGRGAELGDRMLVDGYANGWLVTPDRAGELQITLRWRPQRAVWVGLSVSLSAVVACVAILVVAWRRRSRPMASTERSRPTDRPRLLNPFAGGTRPLALGWLTPVGAAAALVGFVSRPWIGVVVVLVAVASSFHRWAMGVAALAVPVLVVASRVVHDDELVWIALGLVAAEVVGRARRRVVVS